MPMAELIQELVPDPTARAFYQHLTGANLNEESAAAMDTSSYAATANVGVADQASAEQNTTQEQDNSGGDLGW